MSEAQFDGEHHVERYLSGRGLRVERFGKEDLRRGKTPDFRVFANDELAFYCEVKTAKQDNWLERLCADAPPSALVGGVRPDPIYNRISNQIHEAVSQFDAVNPAMDRPNVLAIVNGDSEAGFPDLIGVLTGNAYSESGEVLSMFRAYSEGRIRKEKLRVHLYLWFDAHLVDNVWRVDGPRMLFPEIHPVHHSAVCRYFEVDAAAVERLRSATALPGQRGRKGRAIRLHELEDS